MDSCKKFRPLLAAYLANELEGRDQQQMSEHLSNCVECRASAQKTRALQSLLALKRHEQPDEFFYRQFLARVRQRIYSEALARPTFWQRVTKSFAVPEWTPSLLRGVTATAAVLALLLSVILWFRVSPQNNPKLTQQVIQAPPPNVVYVLDRVPHRTTVGDSSVVTF